MAKATPTRTLNPLPFQDLEPHRFEDLIRQLAYDMRRWKSLEATGRSGSDDGLDIRAIEAPRPEERSSEDDASEEDRISPSVEQLWIFQCKREKSLSPKHIRKIVAESLVSLSSPPYGFILAIACDISKKARDAFREEMVSRRIEEFELWARSELEDKLFQPKNDRLLFAYFGLSLQPRRRSLLSMVRAQIVLKKQLEALLPDHSPHGIVVLLRDPSDERYPNASKASESPARWLLGVALHTKDPGHLTVLRHEFLAWVRADGTGWDALEDHDHNQARILADLMSHGAWLPNQETPPGRTPNIHQQFYQEYVPERERATLKILRHVPYERILAIDPTGDGYHPVPHLLIEFDSTNGPFAPGKSALFEASGYHAINCQPKADNKVPLFPNPLPGILYPPPPGFDQTLPSTESLPDAMVERLTKALDLRKKALRSETSTTEASKSAELSTATLQQFREWRTTVAIPVFSKFVHYLRSVGHEARVNVQSIEPKGGMLECSELVELRIRFQNGLVMRGYQENGSICISTSQLVPRWYIEIRPQPESPVSRLRGNTNLPEPRAEDMTTEDLTQVVAAFLERCGRS